MTDDLRDPAAYVSALRIALTNLDPEAVTRFAWALDAYRDHHVHVLGNGGSMANADHLVLHLRDCGIEAHNLMADLPWLTATANDYDYDSAAARRLAQCRYGSDDALVVISGSGESANVLLALTEAKRQRMRRFGLLGMGGGRAKALCNDAIMVETNDHGIHEDVISAVLHMISRILSPAG